MRYTENPGIILFTKDAMCFVIMPYDYKILVYNVTVSTPTKNMFYFSMTNTIDKYMCIGFDSPTAIGVYFSIFYFLSNSLAEDESGNV